MSGWLALLVATVLACEALPLTRTRTQLGEADTTTLFDEEAMRLESREELEHDAIQEHRMRLDASAKSRKTYLVQEQEKQVATRS